MWDTHEGLKPTIYAAWKLNNHESMVHDVRSQMSRLASDLGHWSGESFKNVRKEIKNFRRELEFQKGWRRGGHAVAVTRTVAGPRRGGSMA